MPGGAAPRTRSGATRAGASRAATFLAVVLAVLLGGLVLWPDGEQVRRLLLDVYLVGLHAGMPRVVTPEWYASTLNVLAVVPLGWLGVVALRRRPAVVVGALAAASVSVELLQATPLLHRDPSLADVLCNTAGAVVGALLGSALVRRAARRGVDEHAGGDEAGDEGAHPVLDDGR